MSLWAMGDFHLNFSQPERSMNPYGKVWVNHEKKIFMNSQKMISPEDTFVVTGDHGWGRRINSCQPDMDFIASLPGRKILLRGNHDMFWNTKKTKQLNEFFNPRLYFLQDNFYSYQAADGKEYALCGTKGICFENLTTYEQFLKLLDRETQRMEKSVGEAWQAGYRNFVLFLHYPPTTIGESTSPFTEIAERVGASHVVYSHSHGEARFHDSLQGKVRGVNYHLVSGDFLDFKPVKILD